MTHSVDECPPYVTARACITVHTMSQVTYLRVYTVCDTTVTPLFVTPLFVTPLFVTSLFVTPLFVTPLFVTPLFVVIHKQQS